MQAVWDGMSPRPCLEPSLSWSCLTFNFPRFSERSYSNVTANVVTNLTRTEQLRHHTHAHHHVSEGYKSGHYLWASVVFLSIILSGLSFGLQHLKLRPSIIRTICSSSARVKEISRSFNSRDPKATKILFCIVAIFFICHTPRIINKCVYYMDFDDRSHEI